MLILSGIFFSICYFIWSFSHTATLLFIGFAFRTLGSTFSSGTIQAYIFDYLSLHKLEGDYEKILGKGNAFRTIGIGAAVLLGGFLSQISFTLILILSALSILGNSAIAILWPEVKIYTHSEEINFWKSLRLSLITVQKSSILTSIAIYSAVVMSIFANLEEFNDVYLQFLTYSNAQIGLLFALATIAQSAASTLAYRFKNYPWQTLYGIAAIGLIILVLASVAKSPFMAIGILSLGVSLELARVLIDGIIQRQIESTQRASIASLNAFLMNVLPFQLLFGLIATRSGFQSAYGFLGLIVSVYLISIVYFYTAKKLSVRLGHK